MEIIRRNGGWEYSNKFINYSPPGWIKEGEVWLPLGYKVVTFKNQSLGLRNNPNIMTFEINKWAQLKNRELIASNTDEGGIWSAINLGDARTLQKHCKNTWNMKTKIYIAAIKNPLFANSYRVKSQGVMLLEEIK